MSSEQAQVTVDQLLSKIGQMSVQIDILSSAIAKLQEENKGLKEALLEKDSEAKAEA